MATCPQCGSAVPEKARFCGTCGTTINPAAPAPAAPAPVANPAAMKTMLGVPSPLAGPAAPPAQPAQPAPASQLQPPPGEKPKHAQTMIGFAAPAAPAGQPSGWPTTPVSTPPAPPQPAEQAPPAHVAQSRTMLGVAVPGIAPAQAQAELAPALRAGGGKTMLGVAAPGIAPMQPGQAAHISGGRTMLGVAAPGIAPTPGPPRVQPLSPVELPPIVPAPPPLVEEAAPAPPPTQVKRGVPVALVAVLVVVVLLVGGGVIALLARGGTPLVASPRVGPQGEDELHITCEKCPDETRVSVGASKATFKGQQADLDLPTPLAVGDNTIDLVLERPGGRAEPIKLVVPVSFRVQTDLAEITATPPKIKVRVEAKPGSQVKIDGKPMPLEGGAATLVVPLDPDASGSSDEMKTVEKAIAYEVAHDGKTEQGAVKARVPIAPLRIDAPSSNVITAGASVLIAGRAVKGATVTVGGAAATSKPDGTFEATIDAQGDMDVVVAAWVPKSPTSAPLGTRTAIVKVHKVASLAEEAKRQDAAYPLGYDAVASAVEANVGQPFVVHGSVLDARTANHQTVLIVDDTRGCAKGRCLVRVVYGGDTIAARGDWVRAYGKITGTVATSDGQKVPDVDASFLLKGKEGR